MSHCREFMISLIQETHFSVSLIDRTSVNPIFTRVFIRVTRNFRCCRFRHIQMQINACISEKANCKAVLFSRLFLLVQTVLRPVISEIDIELATVCIYVGQRCALFPFSRHVSLCDVFSRLVESQVRYSCYSCLSCLL